MPWPQGSALLLRGARGSAARQRRWAGGGDSGRNGAKTIGYEHGKRIWQYN